MDIIELVAVLCKTSIDDTIVVHLVSRIVGVELGIAGNLLRIDIRIDALFPINGRRRLAVAANGANHLMDLPVKIDVNAYRIGNSSVVFGDILSFGKFLLYFVVLGKVFHNRHLCRFLRLNEAVVVAASELRKGFCRDDTQIVVVIEKTSVHIPSRY